MAVIRSLNTKSEIVNHLFLKTQQPSPFLGFLAQSANFPEIKIYSDQKVRENKTENRENQIRKVEMLAK